MRFCRSAIHLLVFFCFKFLFIRMSLLTRDMRDRLAREHIENARSLKVDSAEQAEEALRQLTLAITYNPLYVNALFFRAHVAGRLGHYDMAIADFSITIQLEENSFDYRRLAAAYGGRGGIFRKVNKIAESITDFMRAIEVESDNGTWLYELGLTYLMQGSKALAQHFFALALGDKVTGRMTDNVRFRTYVSLGTCKLGAGDITGAELVLAKGLEIQETAPLRSLLGVTHFLRGEYEKAANDFIKALEMDGLSSEYHVNLGVCYFQLGIMSDALKHFEDAVLRGTKQAVQYFFRGNTELVLGMYPQSIMDLNEAIALDPLREGYHYSKSLAFMEEGNHEEAGKELLIALDLNSDFRTAWVHLGLLRCLQGDLFAALECFTRALELEEADDLVHEFVGLVYFGLKYYDLAVESFSRCIQLRPENALFYFRRGTAFIERGDLYGAYLDLREAVHERGFRESPALHSFSVVLSQLDRHEEALENADAAVMKNNRNCTYLLHRAQCHYVLGNYTDVLADASRLEELGHESAEMFYMCACAHHALRSFSDVAENLQRAVKLQPILSHNPDYCYALGVAYLSSGQNLEGAVDAFTRAIETHPEPPSRFFDARANARQRLGDAAGVLADLDVVLSEEQLDPTVWLRRSLANKALQQYAASARDFEKAKALDAAGGSLAHVAYEKFFEIDQISFDEIC